MRVKKLLSSFLALVMVLSTMSFTAFADVAEPEAPEFNFVSLANDEYPTENWIDDADTSWYEDGEPYAISTAAELAGLAKLVNDGTAFCDKNFNNVTITIDEDIDLAGKMWTPIGGGETNKTFSGILDGNNKTISNVIVVSAYDNVGLFGRCAMNADFGPTARIMNLNVNNATVKASGKDAVGAVVGYGHTELIVDNVNVTGELDISGYRGVAAVVGKGYADIYNSTVEAMGTIASEYWCAGGILGLDDEPCVTIENCKVIGVGDGLTIDGGSYNGAGGIGGYVEPGSTVKECVVQNITIDGDNYYYGGYVCGNEYTAENSVVAGVTFLVNGEEYDAHDAENVEVAVAEVDGEYFTDLVSAFKAVTTNSVVNILSDITIDTKWHCNFGRGEAYGTFNNEPVIIEGNGHTLKFTGEINDGYNQLAVFRTEADLTVKNLTVDMSEAIAVFQNRFSVISCEANDLTVDGCTFIGSTTYTNGRAIIFGEGASAADEAEISVTNSNFINWKYGVVDNMNGVDVAKTVEITESEFTNAGIQISASDEIIVTNNEVSDAYVSITSYSDTNELSVVATGNTLEAAADGYVNSIAANEIEAQEGFVLPSVDANGKKYFSLQTAIDKSTDDVMLTVLGDISDETVTVNKNVTVVASNKARTATTLNNVVFTVEKGAALSLDGFAIEGLSYIYAKEPESVSVSNCNINVGTIEVSGTNCPPAFVLFSSSNNGSVEFAFTNNTLLASPDVTEDWYTYTHGIAGWNSIESATITGNTFGSAEAPLGAAAVKLMNFVDGAEVEVANNTFYVNSQDTTWGPDAIQFYQNNSRANSYTVAITANNFYVDGATAAIGINVNAMGNPTTYTGGATVAVAPDNTVNNEAISISDIIVFGNGINDEGLTRNYVGLDIKYDADKKIIGGVFSDKSLGLEAALATGYATEADVNGNLHVVTETLLVNKIKVEFEEASDVEGEKVYNINLTADGNTINRLNSVDLTFLFSQIDGANEYEIIASNEEVAINPVDNSKVRYEFHYNGKTDVDTDTNATITIGQVKFTGYGKFSFVVDAAANTNAAHATKLFDNIVDTFVPGGVLEDGTAVGEFDVTDNTITDITIAVPDRNLAITVDFPNAITDNVIAYQDMKVVISGGDLAEDITIDLGSDAVATDLDIFGKENAAFIAEMVDGSYVINVTDALTLNNAYTVTVSGAGYRTARYTVTMTEDKALRFWNNVMDEAQVVEIGKDSSAVNVTFLAGDIVKDNKINIYDLSAVVSYFGQETDTATYDAYAKYDLNRDGVIDSKDVAYVLVSWNN